ncbi:unnamed protein product [Symbiodinium sp. CCMP2592]|nr:unnamed protein product [Symbiodinium sp. CCMP2592]
MDKPLLTPPVLLHLTFTSTSSGQKLNLPLICWCKTRNLFKGTCQKKHLPIFENFPAVAGPGQEGFILDFLGVSMPAHVDCEHTSLAFFTPGRSMPCEYLKSGKTLPRIWPMLDEEYLEWADSLTAGFRAAKAARPFRMAELGSGAFGI